MVLELRSKQRVCGEVSKTQTFTRPLMMSHVPSAELNSKSGF